MNSALSNTLAEQWRDALCAYVTHHIMPETLQASSLNMITAEHVSRYFLLDTQVTAAVTTSYVAEALACTQTYVNAIFNNVEPGYPSSFDAELVSFWKQAMSNYSIWAAYQMLEDYPENYIRADLRFDKTQLFQTLENNLAQSKISDATVQNALLAYLKGYEFQNSISVRSGYIDFIGWQQDHEHFPGYGFANSNHYLLGQDAASPPQFYWRQVDVRLDEDSTYIQADAWSEWQTISVPAASVVIQARLVMFCGRLHLVWLSHDEPREVREIGEMGEMEEGDSKLLGYTFKLQIIHLGLDNFWSTPETLWKRDIFVGLESELEIESYRLVALALTGPRGSDDHLLIMLTKEGDDPRMKYTV
ncbi:neuraminidase-like domain-containing protein [Pseudomonas sp. NPDC089752]|uniref:neuraminidase-like domain-containing protein n=1 Tax=Pseudomonas sp. NPDC089752 TaxID=3364472 RepID=UPI0037F66204